MYISINIENDHVVVAYGEGASRERIVGSAIVKTADEIKTGVIGALNFLATKVEKNEIVVVTRNAVVVKDALDNIPSRGGEFWKYAAKNLKMLVAEQVWKDAVAHTFKVTKSTTSNTKFYEELEKEVMSHVAKANKNAAKGNRA